MLISTEKEVIVWVIPEDHGNAFKTKAERLLFFLFVFFKELLCSLPSEEL